MWEGKCSECLLDAIDGKSASPDEMDRGWKRHEASFEQLSPLTADYLTDTQETLNQTGEYIEHNFFDVDSAALSGVQREEMKRAYAANEQAADNYRSARHQAKLEGWIEYQDAIIIEMLQGSKS